MRDLAARGYHAVTLGQVFDHWMRGTALPAKPIVISFDDGWVSQYTTAGPVLRSLHWPAVLNLAEGQVDKPGAISDSQVRTLVTDGWEVNSEAISRADLTRIDPARLHREVAQSRLLLQEQFQLPISFFAYPAGQYNGAATSAVMGAGYRGAVTTQFGLASPQAPFALDRIRVQAGDGVAGVDQKLALLHR